MNDLEKGDTLIREGVDEFKRAALQTANGIIEQGLAVLKIAEGCKAKKGGTDFPDVAMRELGLSQQRACDFLLIGEQAEKLTRIRVSLPSGSARTVWHIARMEQDMIDDKIARGVIHPNATEHQVLEKPRRKRVEVAVKHDDTQLAKDFAGVLAKLKKKERETLRAQYAADLKAAVKEEREKIRAEREDVSKSRTELQRARRMVQDPFTREEYKLILGMLHPDRHPGNETRAKEAFRTFKRIEIICKKTSLKAVK